MKTWIVYVWDNGAYICGTHFDFEVDLQVLLDSYGPPTAVRPASWQPEG